MTGASPLSAVEGCCGAPCTFSFWEDAARPCWGGTDCLDEEEIVDENGEVVDYQHVAVCKGHRRCYPSCDLENYLEQP